MAVRLRLMRIGKTGRPCYRLCAVDSRKPRGGAYIENLGFYDPLIDDDNKKVTINKERAEYWLSVGAQPSETVLSFFRKAQISGLIKPKKSKRRRPKSETKGPLKGKAGHKAKKELAKKTKKNRKKAKKVKEA